MTDELRMWSTEVIAAVTWEPVLLMGVSVRMATMWMLRKEHRKATMDQPSMWRTEGRVLERVKIGEYISNLYNSTMLKQMQLQAMYPKRRLYCSE